MVGFAGLLTVAWLGRAWAPPPLHDTNWRERLHLPEAAAGAETGNW